MLWTGSSAEEGYPVSATFIFVHGAGGSGKSTLARVLIACAGGVSSSSPLPKGAVISYTPAKVALLGPYHTPTGGVDSIHPYALVPQAIKHLLYVEAWPYVFAEGLMTPGVETCRQIYVAATRMRAKAHFVLLDVPIDVCTRNVEARRARKGTDKPYDNHHLIKKHQSANNWIRNLHDAGIPNTHKLTWKKALRFCMNQFELSAEHVKWN
jgi:hypothetical protein